jgi:DNA polymerase (family 10)
VKGFGEKTEQKILDALLHHEAQGERTLLLEALAVAERLVPHLEKAPGVARVELVGSARRRQETVGDLDMVIVADSVEAARAALAGAPGVIGVEAGDDGRITARYVSGLPMEARVVDEAGLAPALLLGTGSKAHQAHRARLEALARERGVRLDDGASEEAIYARLGLPFVPPELREDAGEIEAAQAGARFEDLVELSDVRGMVHCHTVFSDGVNTVEEMARAADALGMEYLTITDHSPAARYANGVTLDALARQWDEIARVQELVKVRLLKGTESDILEDGGLDYPDRILEQMDVVIASVHSRFAMDEDRMTKRLVRAMRQPVFKIWGHALGRLVLRRAPYAARVEEILDAVAESRAAIEVNGDPHRLDLAPEWIRAARRRGIPFVISTDAHSVGNLGYLRFGVWTARRGGLTRGEVLNTRPVDEFARAVRPAGA